MRTQTACLRKHHTLPPSTFLEAHFVDNSYCQWINSYSGSSPSAMHVRYTDCIENDLCVPTAQPSP